MRVKELMDLTGKNAVVTGGTGYLGWSMSEALMELGANVVAISRGESPAFNNDDFDKGKFQNFYHDLSHKDGVNECYEHIVNEYDGIDILVNNSYTWPKKVHFLEQEWEDFEETLDIFLLDRHKL